MHDTDAFLRAYERLNDRQKEAVDAIDGPVVVIAGPGTGKTEVLTLRIANIRRKTDTPPNAILALTFTDAAAANMRLRLAKIIGTDAYHVVITTFHGFCNGVIQEHPDLFPDIGGRVGVGDADQVQILDDLFRSLPLQRLVVWGNRFRWLGKVRGAIDELKREGTTPERFAEIIAAERTRIENAPDLYHEKGQYKGKMKTVWRDELDHLERLDELRLVYAKYQDALAERGLYDYTDMVAHVAHVLEQNADARLRLQERYLYVLIDEHQDTNRAQNIVGEQLARFFDRPNLFVVGDPKQAIYRFQGASAQNFSVVQERYPDCRVIRLEENYRSTQAILNAAARVAHDGSTLAARAGHPELPIVGYAFSSPRAEYAFLSARIQELCADGVPADQIAVLYRENSEAPALLGALRRAGIVCHAEAADDALADPHVQVFLMLLRALRSWGNDALLAEALHADFLEIPPTDIYALLATARQTRTPLWKAMKNARTLQGVAFENPGLLERCANDLSRWRVLASNEPPLRVLEAIAHESRCVGALLNHPDGHAILEKFHALFTTVESMVASNHAIALDDVLDRIALLVAHGIRISSEPTGPERAVQLMTVHKAKGREFDYVFLTGVVAGRWGARRANDLRLPAAVYELTKLRSEEPDDSDTDERNVFYVALTRARKECTITYSQSRLDGKPQTPSQFIIELGESIVSGDPTPYEASSRESIAASLAPLPAGPSLHDVEMIRQRMQERGLTVSLLNSWLRCPWQWFYSFVGMPEEPSIYRALGDAASVALKAYFDAYALGETPESDVLVKRFVQAIGRHPLSLEDLRDVQERGSHMLTRWHAKYAGTWSRAIRNEYAIEGVMLGDIPLRGRLDKLELLDAAGTVAVVDYKTGSPPPKKSLSDIADPEKGNYRRQIAFYKLLLERSEQAYRMSYGQLDFIREERPGVWRKDTLTISDDDMRWLIRAIHDAWEGMWTLSFWNTRCSDPECRACRLRDMRLGVK